jgi:hypothetical protein
MKYPIYNFVLQYLFLQWVFLRMILDPFGRFFCRLWPRNNWPLLTDFHYLKTLLSLEGDDSKFFS